MEKQQVILWHRLADNWYMNRLFTILFGAFFLAGVSSPALVGQESRYADFSQVQGQFWINRSHVNQWNAALPHESPQYSADQEYIVDLLELSRTWFSGMIYGYDFSYTPSDVSRQVAEEFTLTPIYQIPWGDEHLSYLGYREENEKIQMAFRYFPRDYEQARLRGWRSANLVNVGGQASVHDRNDLASREESFHQAVKEALRNYFRQIVANKPMRLSGSLALDGMPRHYVDGGLVYTEVRIFIDADDVEAYEYF